MNGRIVFYTSLSIALIFVLAPPFRRYGGSAKAIAINNAKQIGIAMTEFESQYGHYPIPNQHEDFTEDYPAQERTDSNYILGQLLRSKVLDSEKVFSWRGRNQGDDDFSTPEKILAAGENQFSYISKAGRTPLNNAEFPGETPIVLGPMIAGTKLFDRDYLGESHQMLYLKLDSSVDTCNISQSGKAIIDESQQLGLLDTGKDTIWGDRAPTIHHPLPYQNAPNDKFLQRQVQWKNTKNVLYAGFLLAVIGAFSIPMIKRKKLLPAP